MPFDDPTTRVEIEVQPREEAVMVDKMMALIRLGWCQHTYSDEAGSVCIYGALNVVDNGKASRDDRSVVADNVERRIREILPYPFFGISIFNDASFTSQQDVLSLLQCAKFSFE